MDKVERIKEKINSMMAEEMSNFEESLKDGSHEVSAAPVVHTRLQMLLSFIDSLQEEPKSKFGQLQKEESVSDDFANLVGYLVQDIVANEKDAANFGDEKKPTRCFVEEYLPKFAALFNKEKPVSDDLEQEVIKYRQEHGYFEYSDIVSFARHFAEWGRKHFEDKSEMLSEDLEEAIEKCIEGLIPETELNSATPLALEYVIELLHKTFKAGANWQKRHDNLPVSEDLEDEIKAWCLEVITDLPLVKVTARHFANWQKKQDSLPISNDLKEDTKFHVGDRIRRIIRREFDRDMEVARVYKDYYLCSNIGKFSSSIIPFAEENDYELIIPKDV